MRTNERLQDKISDLEAKLAEKEEEIKDLKVSLETTDILLDIVNGKTKIEFAVEKIQELKMKLREKDCLMENDEHCYPQNAIRWQDVVALIDNQIKQLKEGK